MNNISVTGRLVAEPETRTTTSGTSVTNIRIAVDRAYSKEGKETDFFSATAFGKTAEFITKYFHKGSGIAVIGSMQNNRYQDKEGNNRDKWQIVINNVEFNGGKKETEDSGETVNDDADDLPF